MRAKQFSSRFDVHAKASLVWSRITFSRLTTIYFTIACIHCAIQVIFQAQAFSINAAAAGSLWSIMLSANQSQEAGGFAVLGDDLRICYSVPKSITVKSCDVIWGGTNQSGPSYGLEVASLSTSPSAVATSLLTSPSPVDVTPTSALPVPQQTFSPTSASESSVIPAATLNADIASRISLVIFPTAPATVGDPTSSGQENDNGEGDTQNDSPDSFFNGIHNKRSLMFKREDAADLSDTCIKALIWPVQKLSNTKREDITFIGFQFWVLGMSIVALLNESIPHTIAALLTHLLSTIWSIYQVFETEQFRENFSRVITNGACSPHKLLGSFWEKRRNAEISGAVLNFAVLLASAFLTYKLVKLYGWQTFKRVGASLTINRVYRLVLSLSISIQLALFFIVSAMALWIDQLYNGAIGRLATKSKVYKVTFIIVFWLLIPWLSLGWFAIRRENRRMALVFLTLSLLFIGLWSAMFDSKAFRWTFVTWEFFTVMAITAGLLMISTFILGLACRFNFGKGLPRYLNAEQPLNGSDCEPVYPDGSDVGKSDPEKVEFPSSRGRAIPTFSESFGHGPQLPKKPPQMRLGPERALDMDKNGGVIQAQTGWQKHTPSKSVSSTSSHSGKQSLTRSGTSASHKSSSSTSSGPSDPMGKRWVIE